ncbi:hypothetical protein BAZOLSSOX_480 [uncultured Gammaproteobacteria bacterium]|nr:hypothetical protein BAZOLSSOX_480 [uncultured Gammaproteobacteria bacterium]
MTINIGLLGFNLQVQYIHGECAYEQLLPSKLKISNNLYQPYQIEGIVCIFMVVF